MELSEDHVIRQVGSQSAIFGMRGECFLCAFLGEIKSIRKYLFQRWISAQKVKKKFRIRTIY